MLAWREYLSIQEALPKNAPQSKHMSLVATYRHSLQTCLLKAESLFHELETVVRAKLVRIENSRAIWLAKPMLEVAGLADEVEIETSPSVLPIRPSAHPRSRWAEAAAEFELDGLLDEMTNTRIHDEY
jgi:hypothetical protein